jgi:hypothetical protein
MEGGGIAAALVEEGDDFDGTAKAPAWLGGGGVRMEAATGELQLDSGAEAARLGAALRRGALGREAPPSCRCPSASRAGHPGVAGRGKRTRAAPWS